MLLLVSLVVDVALLCSEILLGSGSDWAGSDRVVEEAEEAE